MIWLLVISVVLILGSKAFWLYALDLTLKQQRRMRIEMSVGDIARIPAFDNTDLRSMTAELRALGFEHAGDLLSKMDYAPAAAPVESPIPAAVRPDTGPPMQVQTETVGVARLFTQPMHGCYASLISVVSTSKFPPEWNRPDIVNVAPFRTVILTISGNDDDSWGYSTHNREVDPFSLLNHHPRQLGHRMVGASARQLLETHLRERNEISYRGKFSWDLFPDLAKYQAYEARGVRHLRAVYERLRPLPVAWHLMTYKFKNHDRWMGELG